MKTKHLLFIVLLSISVMLSNSIAQDNTQVGLPEGAIARFGKGGINVMQFSPDGTRLAVGTTIGVWLYDVEDGKGMVLPPGNVRYFNSLAFSTDGKILASGGVINTSIQLWDTDTGSILSSIKLPDRFSRVSALIFSKDNKTLSGLGANRYITKWDVNVGEELSQKSSFFVSTVKTFSQDGKTFVSGHQESGNIRLWSTASGDEGNVFKETKQDENSDAEKGWNGVHALAYSLDGKNIASAHNDNTIRLWNTTSKTERVRHKGHTQKINALAISLDSSMLASGSEDNTILLWDVEKGHRRGTLKGHKQSVKVVTFSPTENNLLASGSSDGTVRFWDTNTMQETSVFASGYTDSVKAVVFSTDDTMLVNAASNGTVQIWDVKRGRELPSPSVTHYDTIIASAFSSDATLFASHGAKTIVESDGSGISISTTSENVTRLYGLPTGEELLTLQGQIKALALSPDNKILATSEIDVTRLWDVKTGAELFKLDATQFFSNVFLAFSPDGSILATVGYPDTVHLWNVNTGEKFAELKDPFAMHSKYFAFSPDSSILAVCYNNNTLLWDLKTKQKLNIPLTDQIIMVDELTFSPDGKFLVTCSWNYEIGSQIHSWDLTNERKMLTFTGHTDRIQTLAFSHDGKILASGSKDGTVLLWDWDKSIAKIVAANTDKNVVPRQEPVKYAGKAEEAEAVINWLHKSGYEITKIANDYKITHGKRIISIPSSGGGRILLGNVNFMVSTNGVLQIRIKDVGVTVLTFDEKGKLKHQKSNEENQPSEKEIDQ